MKKYVFVKTGEEVNIGDTIEGTKESKNSFGTIKTKVVIKVTAHNINELIEKRVIKCVESNNPKNDCEYDRNNIGFYINKLAIRYKRNIDDVISWLEDTNKICSRAVLDILLNEIAIEFYNIDVRSFDSAETYYSIRLKDGKVGEVRNIYSHIPLFKSKEDAEKARLILKGQLDYMYGEQA